MCNSSSILIFLFFFYNSALVLNRTSSSLLHTFVVDTATQLPIAIQHTGNSFQHQHIPRKCLRASSCLTEKSRHYRIFFMKTFCNVVNAIICCAKEAHASIWILNECNLSCKIVKYCRITGLNRAKKSKFCLRSV